MYTPALQIAQPCAREKRLTRFTEAKPLQPGTTVHHLFAVLSYSESVTFDFKIPMPSVNRALAPLSSEQRSVALQSFRCQLTCAGSRDFPHPKRRSGPRFLRVRVGTSHHVCIDGDGSVRFSEFLMYHQSSAAWDGRIAPSEKVSERLWRAWQTPK